jgi:hypothetical protein
MSRSYEHFRETEGDSIDWDLRNEEDRVIYDGLQAEPPTESRFETPKWFVPNVPPVEPNGEYNPMAEFTAEDWEMWNQRFER